MALSYDGVTPVLYVAAVEPTKKFFVDRLGFEIVAEVPLEDALGFSMLRKDGVTVMIQSNASAIADVGHDAAREMNEAMSERGAVGLYIAVSDVERVVPIVADLDVIVPLRKTDYGRHEITIREPGGHALTFASELPASP